MRRFYFLVLLAALPLATAAFAPTETEDPATDISANAIAPVDLVEDPSVENDFPENPGTAAVKESLVAPAAAPVHRKKRFPRLRRFLGR